jgi:thiol-disulfide isomerase/thioredoxin
VLWFAAVLALAWVWLGHRSAVRVLPAEGAVVGEGLAIVDLDGRPVRLEELRGQVVLLNVWASWCGPCRREIPSLAELHRELGSRGLRVIGINVDDATAGQVRDLRESLEIPYAVVRPTRALDGAFVTRGVVPHTWILDRLGRVRTSHAGYASGRSLRQACERLLDETAPPS